MCKGVRKNKISKDNVNKEFMSLKEKDNKGKYNIYSIKRPSKDSKSNSNGIKKRTINKRKTRKINRINKTK